MIDRDTRTGEANLSEDDKILATMRDHYDMCVQAESVNRAEAKDDLEFANGKHWPDAVRKQRELEFRPCVTVNRLPAYVRQVTNDLRQNRPGIKVHPVDSDADVDTAEVIQGLIRHIEVSSKAPIAYNTGAESAARIGFGFWRVVTEYERPDSFDQCILIKRIRNPFMVYLDCAAQELDGSDAKYGFIVDEIPIDEFKAKYPKAKAASGDFEAECQIAKKWITEKSVRIAEYFVVEETPAKLLAIVDRNGKLSTLYADEMPETLPEGSAVAGERDSVKRRVRWYKTNGSEILEKRDWPGYWIPIIPCYGDEVDIDGEVTRSGIVRFSKDPQRMYNYWKTTETELIALAPKAPFIMAEGQDENYEDMWNQANVRSFSRITYKPVMLDGQLAPPPMRQPFAGPPSGVIQAAMAAIDDIKATTGLHDASMGAQSNETSGKAIMARQREGDVSNFHYSDNQAIAIEHTGRIIIDLIPHIYDARRIIRIIGEDGTADKVEINAPVPAEQQKPDPETGAIKRILNDLTVGYYDVTVSVGPSYTTQRQEAAEAMTSIIQAQPELMQVIGDMVISTYDWPGAAEMAERIKRTIPPQILGEEEAGAAAQIPPEIQMQIQQMQQQMQQMYQALQQAESGLESDRIRAQAQIEVARINAESKSDVEELKGMIAMLLQKMQPPPELAGEVKKDIAKDDER